MWFRICGSPGNGCVSPVLKSIRRNPLLRVTLLTNAACRLGQAGVTIFTRLCTGKSKPALTTKGSGGVGSGSASTVHGLCLPVAASAFAPWGSCDGEVRLSPPVETTDPDRDGIIRIDHAKELAGRFARLSQRAEATDRQLARALDEREGLRRRADDLARLATTDRLTGLRTADAFREEAALRIDAALAAGCQAAVIFIDLDDFKRINDVFGHDAGDAVLSVVGGDIAGLAPAPNLAGRLGGDEFAILVDGPAGTRAVAALVAALRACADLPVPWHDPQHDEVSEIRVALSIGVAYAPTDGVALEALLRRADAAMYADKAAGRSCARAVS